MALLNGIYVHVVDERTNRDTTGVSHPVEDGSQLSDHVQNAPLTVTLTGAVVERDGVSANDARTKLVVMQEQGTLILFQGRNICPNMQIRTFNTGHPNTILGGLNFDMTLVQVRIAKSPYVAPQSDSGSVAEMPPAGDIEVDGQVIFTGGPVYASSSASKPAANRGRSVCKLTQKSGGAHAYHCISTDGGKVYGWVDAANVQPTSAGTPLTGQANGGTQQVV